MKILSALAAITAILFFQTPVTHADTAVGAGFTWVIKKEFLIGVRVFSDNEQGDVVGTAGFDFNFTNNSFRPAIGAAYVGGDGYAEINTGYDLNKKDFDFGIGVGIVNSEEESDSDDTSSNSNTDAVVL